MGHRFNVSSYAQSVLHDIDERTLPGVTRGKHNARDVLEEIRDGITSRIEALNDEIGDTP